MKKRWTIVFSAMLLLGCLSGLSAAAAEEETAIPSDNVFRYCVQYTQKEHKIASYMIHGNNYVKLRDVMYCFSLHSNDLCEVEWDNATQSINLITGKDYTPAGNELEEFASQGEQIATSSTVKLYKDGEAVFWEGYQINDNNYFKLRDIAQTFDFGVRYDSARKRVNMWPVETYAESLLTDPTVPEGAPLHYDDLTAGHGMTMRHFLPYCPLQIPEDGEYTKEYQAFLDKYDGELETITIQISHSKSLEGSYFSNPNKYLPSNIKMSLWLKPSSEYNNYNSPVKSLIMVTAVTTDENGSATLQAEVPKLLVDRYGTYYSEHYSYRDMLLNSIKLDDDGYPTTEAYYTMPDGEKYIIAGGNISHYSMEPKNSFYAQIVMSQR